MSGDCLNKSNLNRLFFLSSEVVSGFPRCSDVSIRPAAAVEGGVGGAEQRGGPEAGRGPGLEHQ